MKFSRTRLGSINPSTSSGDRRILTDLDTGLGVQHGETRAAFEIPDQSRAEFRIINASFDSGRLVKPSGVTCPVTPPHDNHP
jgi:hypothetical protein